MCAQTTPTLAPAPAKRKFDKFDNDSKKEAMKEAKQKLDDLLPTSPRSRWEDEKLGELGDLIPSISIGYLTPLRLFASPSVSSPTCTTSPRSPRSPVIDPVDLDLDPSVEKSFQEVLATSDYYSDLSQKLTASTLQAWCSHWNATQDEAWCACTVCEFLLLLLQMTRRERRACARALGHYGQVDKTGFWPRARCAPWGFDAKLKSAAWEFLCPGCKLNTDTEIFHTELMHEYLNLAQASGINLYRYSVLAEKIAILEMEAFVALKVTVKAWAKLILTAKNSQKT